LVKMASDPQGCKEMGKAGRTVARKHFSPEHVAGRIIQAYKEIAAGVSASRCPERPDGPIQ
jgi:glycosyltransferase involved in cell wall biosynthesis